MLPRLVLALMLLPAAAGTGVAAGPQAAQGAAIVQRGAGAAAACQSCHGASGEGNAAAGFPRLAGLPARYLGRQLEAFAQGQRRQAVMQPIAQALSATDRAALASYYASLRPPSAPAAAPTPQGSSAAVLASRGRWSDGLPACEQCHAPGGRGVGEDFPPLAAQPAAYLANQLRAWKTGARAPGPMGLMEVIAAKLSDADIDGLAQHFAALPATGGGR